MEITSLIKQYFRTNEGISIDVFDGKNIYTVYERIVRMLTQYMEIETTVLQAMSYCFYEILDNVLTHSGKELGTVITRYDSQNHRLAFLIADDGMGIRQSLSENTKYKNISETDALQECIKDSVTDGKGMGFGLYTSALLARNAGIHFEIRSENHSLIFRSGTTRVISSPFWQGTIIFMELQTDIEINPYDVVANRTDLVTEYNETFLQDNELEQLW